MAVILQFEAHIPCESEYVPDTRVWWVNPALWTAPYTASATSRPTEDTALRFLEDESRAIRHRHRHVYILTADERRILALETRCLNEHPAFRYPHERARWIATQLATADRRIGMTSLWTPYGVECALEEISGVIADAEREHVAEVVRKWDARVLDRRERADVAAETARAA